MAALCVCAFAVGFNMTLLTPFAPFYIRDLGLVDDPRRPGYYLGWLLAAPQLGRVLMSMVWGRWSDRHGRRPVIQIGLVSMVVLSVLFPLCRDFRLAVLLRFVGGVTDFIWGTCRTLVAESFPKGQHAQVISMLTASFSCSLILGPVAGGLLARPAVKYPALISAESALATFPYLLPFLMNAVISLAALWCTRLIPETVHVARSACCRKVSVIYSQLAIAEATAEQDDAVAVAVAGHTQSRSSSRAFWSDETARLVSLHLTLTEFMEFANMGLQPLWASAPREVGGLGFSSNQLGLMLSSAAVVIIFAQLFVYPALDKRLGTLQTMQLCTCFELPWWLLMPSIVSWSGDNEARLWTLALLSRGRSVFAELKFCALLLLINNAVHSDQRGAFNGFTTAVSGVGKVVGPVLMAPLFAWSITDGESFGFPLNHWLAFLCCAGCTLGTLVLGCKMPRSLALPLDGE